MGTLKETTLALWQLLTGGIMNKLFTLIEQSSDAAFVTDSKQQVIFWNQTAEQQTGYSAAEAVGQTCWQLLRGQTSQGVPLCGVNCPVFLQARSGRSSANLDMAIMSKSGLRMPLNFSSILVQEAQWPNGEPFLIHLIRPLSQPESQFGTLRLYLLGPLRVQRVDGTFASGDHWPDVEVRALLLLLAQARPSAIHEEGLATLLWPTMPGSIAQLALETAVAQLCLILQPDLETPDKSTHLLYTNHSYRLNPAVPLWRDVDYVSSQLEQARLEPNPQRARTLLKEAQMLFRGDYLADLRETAVWSTAQHLHAQTLHLTILELMGDLMRQNEPLEAKKLYLSALMIDPECQSAYEKLVQLALPHSSTAEALKACQRLAATLRNQLDAMQDEELRQLLSSR